LSLPSTSIIKASQLSRKTLMIICMLHLWLTASTSTSLKNLRLYMQTLILPPSTKSSSYWPYYLRGHKRWTEADFACLFIFNSILDQPLSLWALGIMFTYLFLDFDPSNIMLFFCFYNFLLSISSFLSNNNFLQFLLRIKHPVTVFPSFLLNSLFLSSTK
jgi:hypothetical protein